jgi:hypothetical protein
LGEWEKIEEKKIRGEEGENGVGACKFGNVGFAEDGGCC